MTKTTKFITTVLIAVVLTLSACATADKQKRMNSIDIALNDFRKAVRWGYFEEALSFIQIKDYSRTLRNPDYLKSIRITAYEYGKKHFSEEGKKLNVTALISFYNVDRGTVNDIVEDQTWRFDDDQKRWFLDGDLPEMVR